MKYYLEKLIQEKREWKKDDFVFFWGHRKGKKIGKTCFSQWQEIEFEVDGHKYNCAEQYMMAQKAWLFKDFQIFGKILYYCPVKVGNDNFGGLNRWIYGLRP